MQLAGKHLTFLGDSITYGVGATDDTHRFSTVLCQMTGAIEYNMGISGTTLCTDGERTSRLPHVDDIPAETDVLLIYLGTNDFDACHATQGEESYMLGTPSSTDTSTIYGAAEAYCQKIKVNFKEKLPFVCFVSPLISGWNRSVAPDVRDNFDKDKRNVCGYSIPDIARAQAEVAARHGFASFALHEQVPLSPTDFKDGLHPNDVGMRRIAEALRDFLLSV